MDLFAKKTLLAMKRASFSSPSGDLAFAKMLLYSPSREHEAYDIQLSTPGQVSLMRALVEKHINAGHLGKAKFSCHGATDLLFKIDYLRNNNMQKSTEDFFQEKIRIETDRAIIDSLWKIMVNVDPKAAFSLFEYIVITARPERFRGSCFPVLFQQNWKRSFELCKVLNAYHLFLDEVFKFIHRENYLDFLKNIGISPSEFTIMASQYYCDSKFYLIASFFIKNSNQKEVLLVADKMRLENLNVFHILYLYASVESNSIYSMSDNLKNHLKKHLDTDVEKKLNTKCKKRDILLYLYNEPPPEALPALIPYLSKYPLPKNIVFKHFDLFIQGLMRKDITEKSLNHFLLWFENKQENLEFLKNDNEVSRAFLYMKAFVDIDRVLSLLAAGNLRLKTYAVENARCLLGVGPTEWTEIHYQLVGLLNIANYFIHHNFMNEQSIRKIGNALLNNKALFDIVKIESLMELNFVNENISSPDIKFRIDVLRVFKWCDARLKNSSLSAQFIKQVEAIADNTHNPQLHLWLAEEAENLFSIFA